jgi:hypothetical protein
VDFSDEQLERFGIALNEAVLLGVEIYPVERWASITLAALALPEDGPEPEDPEFEFFSDQLDGWRPRCATVVGMIPPRRSKRSGWNASQELSQASTSCRSTAGSSWTCRPGRASRTGKVA